MEPLNLCLDRGGDFGLQLVQVRLAVDKALETQPRRELDGVGRHKLAEHRSHRGLVAVGQQEHQLHQTLVVPVLFEDLLADLVPPQLAVTALTRQALHEGRD